METGVASAFHSATVPKLFAFLEENRKLRQNLRSDIEWMRSELAMISAYIQQYHDTMEQAESVWIKQVRELAYRIQDCIDRFIHQMSWAYEAGAPATLKIKTVMVRQKFAKEIQKLRKKSEEVFKLKGSYTSGGLGYGGRSSTSAASAPIFTDAYVLEADLVGMDSRRDDLLELIRETQGQPEHLKVVSIVGFDGLGKTLLARQVYESDTVVSQYEPRSWVRAADKSAADVLKEVLHELAVQVDGGNCDDVTNLSASLGNYLKGQRFFIVIDDMRTEFWNIIKNGFPAARGRVIVTTAIQSIANACSYAHGHVYRMRTLDEDHSRQLFFKVTSLEDPPDMNIGPEPLKKCDGLPLALVTAGQFLQSKRNPTWMEWEKLCRNLGEHLHTEDTLARMKHVLVHSYASLPDHLLKAFLLYFGVFPFGHPVRRGRFIRRWLAEGFVERDGELAARSFEKLVDLSIIQPIDVSNNTEVKTCQTHGMMHEFIQHKSICENFITLLYDQARPSSIIRWLSLHHKSAARATVDPKDLALVRSLTIFGKADKSVLEFSNYELLRVLDLED